MIGTALFLLLLARSACKFDEQVDIIPLQNGLILSHFQFTQSITVPISASGQLMDYGTFPPAIEEIVSGLGLDEARLSFVRGRWDQTGWGRAPVDLAGNGIQLHAWFQPDGGDVDERWTKLTHLLSGLLCGSIGLMADARTSIPQQTFSPPYPESHIRFGALPREAVCTENLTPWIKMLPCMSNAGLGSLLNPVKIYDSRYNLMDLVITSNATPSGRMIRLVQNLVVVTDLVRWNGDADWTLTELFERNVQRPCPISTAKVNVWYSGQDVKLIEGCGNVEKASEMTISRYSGNDLLGKEIGIEYTNGVIPQGLLPSSPITIDRFITGSGQERGTIFCRLENREPHDIEVTVLEVIPWYMRLSMHTFKISVNGEAAPMKGLLYSPAVDRVKPSQIEWTVLVPGNSAVTAEVDFDMTLLRYSEYPLDPSRGFDVNGTVVKYRVGDRDHRIVSNTMLLTLPTPDFTMPFNVIMLTCLAMTFFYGFLFNLTFRRHYLYDPAHPKTLLGRISLLVRTRVLKLKSD